VIDFHENGSSKRNEQLQQKPASSVELANAPRPSVETSQTPHETSGSAPAMAQKVESLEIGTEFQKKELEKSAAPVDRNSETDNAVAVVPASDVQSAPSPEEMKAEPSETREPNKRPRRELFTMQGQLRNETAYRVASPSAFSKIKNFAYLEINGKFSQHFSYDLSTRLYYDAVYDVTSTFSENVKQDQQWDAELRKAFVDISAGPMDLRLGKQQIVWGQAVNLFFADVVNPRDLREFVLPDLDDIRIPSWAADLEFSFGSTHMEFVALPILDHDKIGVPGSDFFPRIPSLPQNADLNIGSIKMPANNARNGVYGFHLSQLVKGWDLSAFYLYGYDYTPTFFRRIEINPDTQRITIDVMPEITRQRTVGTTFSKDFSGVVLKGEFVYDREKNFIVTDPSNFNGIAKSDYFEYLLGVDYTFFRRVDSNVQFFQQFILKPVPTLFQNDRESFASIRLKTGFFNNRLEPEVFYVSRLNGNAKDYMLRPKLNYTFNSHWRGALGADLFGDDRTGDFGQFNNANRIYVQLRYIF
jgi:hypothetical protein